MYKYFIIFICFLCFSQFAHADLKVVDGDSLEQNNERIRLEGIDAPEYLQICENALAEEYNCGEKSTQYLQELIANKDVNCECLKQSDKYDRKLCECFIDNNVSLNQEMIRAGWATRYRTEKYLSDEQDAKQKGIGLWQGKFMRPALFRILQKFKNN